MAKYLRPLSEGETVCSAHPQAGSASGRGWEDANKLNRNRMNINRVTLLGNLAQDVKTATTKTNKNVSRFTVATNFAKSVEYHTCIAWDKLSEIAKQYLKKGDRVYVEGRLSTKTWEDKDKKKRYTTEIVANHLIMLGRGNGAALTKPDEVDEGDHGM